MGIENSNTPFFSIIIPTYNRAHMLPASIRSILNQKFQNFEAIIIDDGSTDNTSEVVNNISDKRIRYIYQTNQERSAARNNGIKNAKGEYICFLDSDDLFVENHLQVLFDYIILNNHPMELIFTNCFFLNNEQNEKPDFPLLKNNPIIYFLQNSVIPDRVCIHKNILTEFQFRIDANISEDTILWVSIANKYPIKQLDEHTVQYRIHDDNSVNIKYNCYFERLKGLEKLFKDESISKKAGKTIISETLSICYLGIARHYEYKRSFIKMAANLFMSFIYQPSSKYNKSKVYMVYKYLLLQK